MNGGCASLGPRFLRLTGENQIELRSWRLASQIIGARFKWAELTRTVSVLKCILDSVHYALRVRLLQLFVSVAIHQVKCCDRNLSFRIDGVGGKRSLVTGVEINVFRSHGCGTLLTRLCLSIMFSTVRRRDRRLLKVLKMRCLQKCCMSLFRREEWL